MKIVNLKNLTIRYKASAYTCVLLPNAAWGEVAIAMLIVPTFTQQN